MATEAAFFDLDKTVIARASMIAFGPRFQRAGLLSRWVVARALWGQLVYMWIGADEKKLTKTRDAALKLTRGWEQQKVRTIVRDALNDVIEPIVFEEALELIREHQHEGRLVAIVSASPIEVVEPLTEYLGADVAIATEAKVVDGRYSGELVRYCYGPAKAVAILELAEQRGIDLSESYAYSDSVTDLPMMELVGHPVAVNPDRALLRAATERGWDVVRFVKPVRLRDRVPMPTAKQTVAGGGAGALVAAALVVFWRLRREPPVAPPGRWTRVRRRAASWPRRRRGKGG